jgi:hypothetical protein
MCCGRKSPKNGTRQRGRSGRISKNNKVKNQPPTITKANNEQQPTQNQQ